jgi:hypothetical protein
MIGRFVSILLVLGCSVASVIADDSPPESPAGASLPAELQQAQSTYLAAVEAAGTKLHAELAELEQRITNDKRLKPAEKLQQLEQLTGERERFESQGVVPKLPALKRLVDAFHKELRPARNALEKSFDDLANRALKTDRAAAEAILEAKQTAIDSAGPTTAALEDDVQPSGAASYSKINAFKPGDWVLPRNRGFQVTREGWFVLTKPDTVLSSKKPWPPGHEVVVSLSAAPGTKAFVTLGTDGTKLIAAPIADNGQTIQAGMQSQGLEGRPSGIAPVSLPYDAPFEVSLRKVGSEVWVRINGKVTSGVTWGKKDDQPGTPVGIVSLLLKEGRMTIHKLEVRPAP